MDIFNRSDIQAAGGLYEDHKIGLQFDLAAHDSFLLIAAAHGTDLGYAALAASDIIFLDKFFRVCFKFFRFEHTVFPGKRLFVIGFQSKVVPEGKVQDQAVFLAVLGNIGNPGFRTFADGFIGNILSVKEYLSGRYLHQTGNGVRQFYLSVSGYAGDREYFALVYFKGDIFYDFKMILIVYTYIFHFQHCSAKTGSAFFYIKGNIAPYHQICHLFRGRCGYIQYVYDFSAV